MGALDSILAMFGGGDSQPQPQPQPAPPPGLLASQYDGWARLGNALSQGAATHSVAGLLGGALDPMAPIRLQQAGVQNQMLQQRYNILQDALNGSGAFGSGVPQQGGQTAQGAPVGPPPLPPQGAPMSDGQARAPMPQMQAPPAPPTMPAAGAPQPQDQPGPIPAPPMGLPPQLAQAGPGAAPTGGGMLPGLSTDLYRKAMLSEMLIPGSGKTMLDKNMPGYQAFRGGGYMLKPDGSLMQLPQIPENMTVKQMPDGSFQAVDVPGARGGMAANEATKQAITGQREKDVAGFTQRAIGGRETQQANDAYTRATGQTSPTTGSGLGVTSAPRTAGGPLSAGAGLPALPPPGPGGYAPPASSKAPEAVTTERGTSIPLPPPDQIAKGTIPFTTQNANSQKTEENWNAIRPTIETARNRLMLTANVFQSLEGKGLNEQKAEASNTLRGLGMDWLADKVMSANDTVGVQTALWNSMQESLSALKTINAGTGGRILNSEFNAFMEHGFSPNMLGKSLHNAVSQQLGQIYQTQNMIDDYFGGGKKVGWEDANRFQSAYLRANPLEGFVEYAKPAIGEFKGMGGTPNAPAKGGAAKGAAGLPAAPNVGDIIDGHRFLGGNPALQSSWQPVQQ